MSYTMVPEESSNGHESSPLCSTNEHKESYSFTLEIILFNLKRTSKKSSNIALKTCENHLNLGYLYIIVQRL